MLEFQNVSAGYGTQDVLHDLTFTTACSAPTAAAKPRCFAPLMR